MGVLPGDGVLTSAWIRVSWSRRLAAAPGSLLWAVAVDSQPAIPIREPDPPFSSLRNGIHGSYGYVQPLRVEGMRPVPGSADSWFWFWLWVARAEAADGALSLPVLSQTSISSLMAQACRRHKKAAFRGRKRPVRKKKSAAALRLRVVTGSREFERVRPSSGDKAWLDKKWLGVILPA